MNNIETTLRHYCDAIEKTKTAKTNAEARQWALLASFLLDGIVPPGVKKNHAGPTPKRPTL